MWLSKAGIKSTQSFLAYDYRYTMMKAILAILAFVTASNAFQAVVPISSRSTSSPSALSGFLDGKGKAISVREDEDKKMWFEPPKKKKVVAAAPATKGKTAPVKAVVKKGPAKPDPKKAKKLEVAAGFNGFKFPWDK